MTQATIAPKPAEAETIAYCYESGRAPEAGIVTPVLNGGRFLPDCLESACRQEGVLLDIIVVDDGSIDDSVDVAKRILESHRHLLSRALVIGHNSTTGPAAARNTGMRYLTAPAALLLDADNVIYPRCVRRCHDALEASKAAFAYPILRVFGDRTGLLGWAPFEEYRLAQGNYIDTLALVRRSAWEAVGGFPDLREGWEDYAFWLTLLQHGLMGVQVPEILGAYRSHCPSRTNTALQHKEQIYGRLKEAFPWLRLTPTDDND